MKRRKDVDKKKLIVGQKYLRRRKTTYGNHSAEAESYLECVQITPAGAVFFCGERLEKLTDKQIQEEIIREAGKNENNGK